MEEYKSQDKIKNKKQKNMIVLPYLNNENKNNLIEPNSILAKFIRNKKNEFVKFAENELKRPIKLYINRNKGNKGNIKFLSKDKLNNKNIFITDNNISVITSSNKEKENDSENNDNNSNLETNQNRINTISYEYKKPLRLSLGTDKINLSPIQNDIEYQYKIINDEYKLLEDNYNFYTTRVIRKANYYDAFSSSSLMSKINYNKALEETIGILYILPQLLLLN